MIASVSISTPSSMVVVGLRLDSTLALSMRREAEKSSFLSSSCFFVRRGGLGGGSVMTCEGRVAVNDIWLWSEAAEGFPTAKGHSPFGDYGDVNGRGRNPFEGAWVGRPCERAII